MEDIEKEKALNNDQEKSPQDEFSEEKFLELEEELKDKEEELEELTDSYLRLQADFMNYKKRMEREKISTIDYANEDLITELLPILDNFERALSSVKDKNDSFCEGMKMIYDQMIEVLKINGLEEIQALGEKFDPNYHHAAFMEESEDGKEGIVLEVFQKGYKLNDKVIRPSMVKVAK